MSNELNDWLMDSTDNTAVIRALEKRVEELEAVLSELYDLVKGECPALLDEDRGGNARLDIAVNDILGGGGK